MFIEHVEVEGRGRSFLGEQVSVHVALPDDCQDCGGIGFEDLRFARVAKSWGPKCRTCGGSGVVTAPARHRDPAFDPFAEKPAPFLLTVGW